MNNQPGNSPETGRVAPDAPSDASARERRLEGNPPHPGTEPTGQSATRNPHSAIRRDAPNRDSVTTIRQDGSRPFLHPADTRGRFTIVRRLAAFALIAFYLSLPWIKINGYPAVFLDVAARRFHLFGITLAAQDLWLLFFLITGLGFTLFFVTALLGRIWCGWACPQTVFLDHVYRRIERWIEGDAVKRRALDSALWTPGKIAKRVSKHAAYILVSAGITHLFLAYFVSIPEVWSMMTHAPFQHWASFVFIGVSTAILYFNFAWFREQLCIVICPYGRIQSALIDDHSLVIGYDTTRGEPRAPLKRGHGLTLDKRVKSQPMTPLTAGDLSPVQGDCIDCFRCVHVCPTGIDIRQGLQMECVGCTACIDACDEVMLKLKRPRGLIRYDSQSKFAGARTRWLRPRTILYFALLCVGAGVATWALSTVHSAAFSVTRMIGSPYIVDTTSVRNQFLVRIVNKLNEPSRYVLTVEGAPDGVRTTGFETIVEVAPLGEIVQPLILQQTRGIYTGPFHFKVHVANDAHTFDLKRDVDFLGPDAKLLMEDGR